VADDNFILGYFFTLLAGRFVDFAARLAGAAFFARELWVVSVTGFRETVLSFVDRFVRFG
jgi:hypothetical protein